MRGDSSKFYLPKCLMRKFRNAEDVARTGSRQLYNVDVVMIFCDERSRQHRMTWISQRDTAETSKVPGGASFRNIGRVKCNPCDVAVSRSGV